MTDVRLPGRSGLELLAQVTALDAELPVIVVTGHGDVEMAVAAMRAGADAATLEAAAAKIARGVDGSRLMHLNVYLTFHDAVIGRLLIAAGQPDQARERLEMSLSLAEETGMHFHDAELLRLRAHTVPPDQRRAALADALDFARRQDAVLFELRCLIDSFELFGDGDREGLASAVNRLPGNAGWPEQARAERILS